MLSFKQRGIGKKTKKEEWLKRCIPILLWSGMIVVASSMPYEQQDFRPYLHSLDLSWVEEYFSWVSFTYSTGEMSIANRGTERFVEFFIRKGAHLFVFGVLAFLLYRLFVSFQMKGWLRWGFTLLLILIFASMDEFRHFHHPDRTGLLQDVILDLCGGLIGISLAWIRFNMRGKKRGLDEKEGSM